VVAGVEVGLSNVRRGMSDVGCVSDDSDEESAKGYFRNQKVSCWWARRPVRLRLVTVVQVGR
jgi:hypothetical protein